MLLRLLQSDDYSFPLAYLIATTFWCVQVSVRNRKDGNFLCVSTAMSGHSGQFVSELLRWFLSLSSSSSSSYCDVSSAQVRETQALILAPTRELAGQIQKVLFP